MVWKEERKYDPFKQALILAFPTNFNRGFRLDTIKTEIKYNPPPFFYKELTLVTENIYNVRGVTLEIYTKCPEGNKESPVLLLFYFLNCCGHMVIHCIILYTLLYILNISFFLFFYQQQKRRICWRPSLVSFSLPESLTARASRFPGESFPTKGQVPQHAHKLTQQCMSKLLSRKWRAPWGSNPSPVETQENTPLNRTSSLPCQTSGVLNMKAPRS